jgi:hypothetical protein
MAIVLQFFNVIVQKNTIVKKYLGGLEQYKKDCPNKSYLEDENLTRVGFMNENAMNTFLNNLALNGLEFDKALRRSEEIAVVSTWFGFEWESKWLEIKNGLCFLK